MKIAILTIGVVLALNWPVPSAGKSSQEPQNGATNSTQYAKRNANPAQPSAPSLAPVANPETTSQNEKKAADISDKTDDKPSPDWIARFTGLLVFVTFLQLVALAWQIRTSRSTARKELQAYVLPVGASRYTENGVPKLKVILRNSGKTPALKCVSELFRGIGPVIKPLPKRPDTSELKSLRSDSFIAPGSDIWMLDADVLSSDEAKDIKNGVRALYAIGTISYQDVFNLHHTSRYQFMCVGHNLDSGTFVFCDEGNEID